jgi:hypothetical protein
MTWGRYYWPFFLVLVSLLFLGPELIALFTNAANTLSEYAWAELNVSPRIPVHTIAWWVSLLAFILAVFVLVAHIWFKRIT